MTALHITLAIGGGVSGRQVGALLRQVGGSTCVWLTVPPSLAVSTWMGYRRNAHKGRLPYVPNVASLVLYIMQLEDFFFFIGFWT